MLGTCAAAASGGGREGRNGASADGMRGRGGASVFGRGNTLARGEALGLSLVPTVTTIPYCRAACTKAVGSLGQPLGQAGAFTTARTSSSERMWSLCLARASTRSMSSLLGSNPRRLSQ